MVKVKESKKQKIENLYPKDAFTLTEKNRNNPEFEILDIRTPEEFEEGHIENAENLNSKDKDFKSNLEKKDKNKKYLVYCRTGRKSMKTVDMMKDLEFKEVYNLLDGIEHWKKSRLPITPE